MPVRLKTRGSDKKAIAFDALFSDAHLRIYRVDKKTELHVYSANEISLILKSLAQQFSNGYFPLANNVKLLGQGAERTGLGRTILQVDTNGNITHAQGASYLGPCLEHLGYCQWNGGHHGIQWRLMVEDITDTQLLRDLSEKFAA